MSNIEAEIKAAATACSTPGGAVWLFGIGILAVVFATIAGMMLGG